MTSVTGNPFRAYAIAGASTSLMGNLPNFAWSSNQASTAPGTDTGSGPVGGMVAEFSFLSSARRALSERDFGERPLPLRPRSFWVFASQTMANKSPPTPLLIGSMSPRAALAAIAASTAVPPRLSTSSATWLASGWLVAAMPCVAMTSERVGTSDPLGRGAPAKPSPIVMLRMAAIPSARAMRSSGRLLGTRDARLEYLSDFSIENALLKTALGVVSDHAPPECNRDRIAQVLGDFPASCKTIEDELDCEAAHTAAAEGARDKELRHAVVDGGFAGHRVATRHHRESHRLSATQDDE